MIYKVTASKSTARELALIFRYPQIESPRALLLPRDVIRHGSRRGSLEHGMSYKSVSGFWNEEDAANPRSTE